MTPKTWTAGALIALMFACAEAPAPPEIIVDRTACSQCGMLVSERRFAAASTTHGQPGRVFDDIGCLVAATRASGRPDRVWFHDFNDGLWIPGGAAPVFVRAASVHTPMAGGVVAFADATAAARFAADRRGDLFGSFAELQGGWR